MRPPEQGPLAWLARAVEPLFRAAVARRNRRFDGGTSVRRVAVPVVSVGNVTVGGTGKTPLVLWLAERARGRGRRPAIVSRGYGGRAGRGPLRVDPEATDGARRYGDEPWLLARRLPESDVVVGSDRFAGARLAASRGADLVILDDGFQHRRLARDLDVVVLDARRPFDNGRMLPAGLLREPPESLARADAVVLGRHRDGLDTSDLDARLATICPSAARFVMRQRPAGWFRADGSEAALPQRRFGFCGIGNPGAFRRDLLREPGTLVGFRAFGDHHRFRTDEYRGLLDAAEAADAWLATTEKDLARMSDAPAAFLERLCVLRIAVEIDPAEALVQRVLDAGSEP